MTSVDAALGALGGSSLFVEANGIRFHCRTDGPAGAPWIVFSNSLATNLAVWDQQVSELGSSFRILRYDQRGHGGTEVSRSPCTFDLLADDAARLLDAFDIDRATVIGVSMGAVTALRLAVGHPARLCRVVACDGQWAAPSGAVATWEARIRTATEGGMAALVESTVQRWFTPDFLAANPPVLDKVRRMIRETPLAGFTSCARALQDYDFRIPFSTIDVPTLLIVGGADGLLPQVMREMQRTIAGSAFVEIAQAGHLPNVERPEAFNQALRSFLQGSR